MLKSLHIENLTVFREANLEFGKNLNVIIGENGLGKTHLLKAIYSGIAASADSHFNHLKSLAERPEMELQSKLSGVFRAESLLNLIHRGKSQAKRHFKTKLTLGYQFEDSQRNFELKVAPLSLLLDPRTSGRDGQLWAETDVPQAFIETRPVFLPTRELLTIYPGFVSLYETTHLPFEETWRDTAILLGAPLAKGEREKRISELLEPLEKAMGGSLILEESGRFYLQTAKKGRIEMHLLAEGFRKLGMIARLIATGALLDKGFLFWDEPESNLNPKIIKTIARSVLQISGTGVQVFVATHSLFLLRELFILQQKEFKTLETRCFGLHGGRDGVTVQQGATIDDVGEITALDEDLLQSERYMDLP